MSSINQLHEARVKQGLTNKEFKTFYDLMIKANTQQINVMKWELQKEIYKRKQREIQTRLKI